MNTDLKSAKYQPLSLIFTTNRKFQWKIVNVHKFHDFSSCLQTLVPLHHQANKFCRSSSVQNMNSLYKISGLTAGY